MAPAETDDAQRRAFRKTDHRRADVRGRAESHIRFGCVGLDVTLRMVESASAENVPYDVLKKQPHWFNQQISDYLEEFVGAPAPDPLETWRRQRREAMAAELKARAEAEAFTKAEEAKALAIAAELSARTAPPS